MPSWTPGVAASNKEDNVDNCPALPLRPRRGKFLVSLVLVLVMLGLSLNTGELFTSNASQSHITIHILDAFIQQIPNCDT